MLEFDKYSGHLPDTSSNSPLASSPDFASGCDFNSYSAYGTVSDANFSTNSVSHSASDSDHASDFALDFASDASLFPPDASPDSAPASEFSL